jgi:uncharacterized protein (AIM24 family)
MWYKKKLNHILNSNKIYESTRNRVPDFGQNAICRNRTGSQEIVIAEAGSFMMMDNNIKWKPFLAMAQQSGLFGKLLNAGKRVLTGESFHDGIY